MIKDISVLINTVVYAILNLPNDFTSKLIQERIENCDVSDPSEREK